MFRKHVSNNTFRIFELGGIAHGTGRNGSHPAPDARGRAVDGCAAVDCRNRGWAADQRGAGSDFAAGDHGFDRAPAVRRGRGHAVAFALDGAPAQPVHVAGVFRFPSISSLKTSSLKTPAAKTCSARHSKNIMDVFPLQQLLTAAVFVGARVSGLMIFCPFLGSSAIPAPVKAALTLLITGLLYPLRAPLQLDLTTWQWAGVALSEVVIGLVL